MFHIHNIGINWLILWNKETTIIVSLRQHYNWPMIIKRTASLAGQVSLYSNSLREREGERTRERERELRSKAHRSRGNMGYDRVEALYRWDVRWLTVALDTCNIDTRDAWKCNERRRRLLKKIITRDVD